MAYGNWGAWVFRNGTHMPTHEDQTPYKETEYTAGYGQVFGWLGDKLNETTDPDLGPHHAVLGAGRVRLCGYKNYPSAYLDGVAVALEPFKLDNGDTPGVDEWWTDDQYHGFIEGVEISAQQFDGNMLDLLLVEPDGTRWTSRCGYCYGAGHMDDDSTPIDWSIYAAAQS